VLRRINARARCGTPRLLGAREPLMHRLVPRSWREMGSAYPDSSRRSA
jgi:alanyl-tRNA synthetase